MKHILLCVWAEPAVLGSTTTALKFTYEIQCMGQDISLKNERKTCALSHDLSFSANTINCVCQSIRSMFKVLDMYNFECIQTFNQRKNILAPQNMS